MLTFLFWNAKQTAAIESVVRLVKRHDVDVLILAECPVSAPQLAHSLDGVGSQGFWSSTPLTGSDILILTRVLKSDFETVQDASRIALRRIRCSGGSSVLLAAVHLVSAMWRTKADQRKGAEDAIEEIVRNEDSRRMTIVVGDFNMNPFDEGMVNANAFHALMCRTDVTGQRKVLQKSYMPFYNPMWSLLGDRGGRAPSTFRRGKDGVYCLFWNLFDQVILREGLIGYFDEHSLQILEGDGQVGFRKRANLDTGISDHLPILFRINLNVELEDEP